MINNKKILDLDNNKNINHNLINFMNKYNMNIEDLEIILKLEKLNNGDDKIKKHFNNNLFLWILLFLKRLYSMHLV